MQSEERKVKVGISMGDYNGVGMEVILKTFADERMFNICTPVLYGSPKIYAYYKKMLELENPLYNISRDKNEVRDGNRINLRVVLEDEVNITPGEPSKEAGDVALKSLQAATADLKDGGIDVLITAPIDKNTIQAEGFNFSGHTEYLAQELEAQEHIMLLIADNLRVGLVTGHVPVNKISENITKKKIISKIKVLQSSLIEDFGITKPRIAVLALNPHSGDNGLIGKEEEEVIIPAIEEARRQDILAFGPYPADGFFGSNQFKQFDAVLAMYHDQGLIPFKYMAFNDGVNFTAGLSAVRTSPDHGTAYGIAGKNQADVSSFRNAIYAAIDIYRNRNLSEELKKNPLGYRPMKREKFRLDL